MENETCNMCAWFGNEMKPLRLHEGKFFTLFFPQVPMVYREDGGHLILIPNRHVVDVRFFSLQESDEYIKFMKVASTIMYDFLPTIGIDVGRINYHDNGNLEADKVIGAHQHLHIFGRSRVSVNQVWKDYLRFPAWSSDEQYYKNSTHFDSSEKDKIRLAFKLLFNQ